MADSSQRRTETLPSTQTPSGLSDNDERRVHALFEEWILLLDQGREVSVAELCRDCPHLAETLAQEIALHRRFEPPARVEARQPEPPVKEFAGLRYQPVRFLAQGGLGVVFAARDREVGREVALKRIQERRQHLPRDRERFPREAEITGRLEHPGIVPVYSVGHDTAGHPYYTMRLVAGRTLAEAVEAFHQGPQRPRSAGERNPGLRALLNRFVAVCQTIGYAHSRGVIHRDLKPSNVLLGDYGETLVIDWGLARQMDGPEVRGGPDVDGRAPQTSTRTETGSVLGTWGFMSPEQARGDWAHVGPASDVFSLGATLYAILTGQAPRYSGPDEARAGKFARPRQVSRTVPPALEAVCLRAMAATPEERYPAALELAADVQSWLDDEPVRAYREPLPARVARWGRRHRTRVAVGVVLLAAGVVGLSLGLWAVGREQARTSAALQEAEDNLKLARQAIDECFNVAKKHPLFQKPSMEQAKKLLLERTLPYYRHFRARRPNDPGLQRAEAEQWARVAFIERTFLRTREALDAFEKSRDLLVPLVQAYPDVPEYQHDLAATQDDLGDLLLTLGKHPEALQAYEQSRDLLAKLVEAHPDVALYRAGLAATHNNRGNLLQTLGRGDEALQDYQQAEDLQGQLLKAHPESAEYQNDLAQTHNNRGNLLLTLGKRPEALQSYQQAHDLQANLAKAHPEVPGYQHDLARMLYNRGVLLDGLGQGEESRKNNQQAHDLLTELVEAHPEVPDYRHDLSRAMYNRGRALHVLGKYEDACKEWRLAHDLQAKLVEAHPDVPDYVESQTRTSLYRGLLLAHLGRYPDSLADLDRAVSLVDRLGRLDARNPHISTFLPTALQRRAEVLSLLGKADRDTTVAAGTQIKLTPVEVIVAEKADDDGRHEVTIKPAGDPTTVPMPDEAWVLGFYCGAEKSGGVRVAGCAEGSGLRAMRTVPGKGGEKGEWQADPGDVITHVNGYAVNSVEDVICAASVAKDKGDVQIVLKDASTGKRTVFYVTATRR